MFILTDGKNYVMENPYKNGIYISTTSSVMAKEFSYKQARAVLNSKSKRMKWISNYYMVNKNTGQVATTSELYNGNGNAYVGENDIEFDESIITQIYGEAEIMTGLAGWSMVQLKAYEEELRKALSKYDSAESDIKHALEKYKKDNDGKNPQAHKAAKISYLLGDIREKHRKIKMCMRYIQVFKNAITQNYTIEKIKLELEHAQKGEYKGRTEYYGIALGILNGEVNKNDMQKL